MAKKLLTITTTVSFGRREVKCYPSKMNPAGEAESICVKRVFADITLNCENSNGVNWQTVYTACVYVPPLPNRPEIRVKDPRPTSRKADGDSLSLKEARILFQRMFPDEWSIVMGYIIQILAEPLAKAEANYPKRVEAARLAFEAEKAKAVFGAA